MSSTDGNQTANYVYILDDPCHHGDTKKAIATIDPANLSRMIDDMRPEVSYQESNHSIKSGLVRRLALLTDASLPGEFRLEAGLGGLILRIMKLT